MDSAEGNAMEHYGEVWLVSADGEMYVKDDSIDPICPICDDSYLYK